MSRSRLISTLLLLPLSKLFGAAVWVRNKMFDKGMLKQAQFDVPVLVVGNLAVGGTGKTPHVEYLVGAFSSSRKVAVLSRGYRRATKGFVLATPQSRPEDIGDEPYQIYRKFSPYVMVGVCEKRVEGINRMLEIDPEIEMFILDDAFQHRYVQPQAAIVLTEFNRPASADKMLPYGRLREPLTSLSRADVVVISKCPDGLKPIDYRTVKENLKLFPFQQVFFSRYTYGHLVPVFPEQVSKVPQLAELTPNDSLLCLTGIANPWPFRNYLKGLKTALIKGKRFPDHHYYSSDDMKQVEAAFDALPGDRRYIITTEKDAVRLFNNPYFPHRLKKLIFYLPISVEFIDESGMPRDDFAQGVEKALRNGKLFK